MNKLPIANCRLPIAGTARRSRIARAYPQSAFGNWQSAIRWCLVLLLLVSVYVPVVNAQDAPPQPSPTPLPAPPPPKIITREERAQLNQTTDAKARIRATIDLAAARLTRAEQLTKQSEYAAAGAEIGSYEALIQDALDVIDEIKRDSNKIRDICKRLELALRGHAPRLTTMRRETPLEHAVWIKRTEEFARSARTEVLNRFYGHTVVKDPQKTNNDKNPEKPKDTPTPTPKSDQP